jgi:hypothetical protein
MVKFKWLGGWLIVDRRSSLTGWADLTNAERALSIIICTLFYLEMTTSDVLYQYLSRADGRRLFSLFNPAYLFNYKNRNT